MKEGKYNAGQLLQSVRYRLLGEVIPSLRGVAVGWEDNCMLLYYYHDGEITDKIEDHYYCISTEVISGFPGASIDEKVISLKYPQPLPRHEHWAYKRREPFEDPGVSESEGNINLEKRRGMMSWILSLVKR